MSALGGSLRTIADLLREASLSGALPTTLQQLDATSKEPQALVLCPSRELAFQTYRVAELALAGSGLRVGAVAGGANPQRQIEKVRKERPQLLVGTAGRVCELAFERGKLKLQRVRHLVLDEVDAALQPPHLDDTRRLLDYTSSDGRPLQLVFASATADTIPAEHCLWSSSRHLRQGRSTPAAAAGLAARQFACGARCRGRSDHPLDVPKGRAASRHVPRRGRARRSRSRARL